MVGETERVESGQGGGWCHPLIAVLLLALVLALALLSWSVWEGRGSAPALSPGPVGALYGVTLLTGSVYYGRLVEARPGHIKLADIYYVESFAADASGRRDNRLVNRQKNDWHAPDLMTIPTDKILMIEPVGVQSRLAKLIEQEKALPAPK
jgi:hypothetical protein